MGRTWSLIALVMAMAACASVENFAYVSPHSYTEKDPGSKLDVYYLVPGAQAISQAEGLAQSYDIIANFEVKQFGDGVGNLQEKAQEKAREVGGDAIVYQPLPTGDDGSKALVWVIRYKG